jgi:hypothetical protein
MEAELRRQQLTTYRAGEDKRFVWTPTSVAIETADGHVLDRFETRAALSKVKFWRLLGKMCT